ncbi:MAG: hypothetical protein MJA83_05565 [Gammaproteobacteria bacterium]|nr:hypothetical protein [Gammaproteobacteria bacterium]
MAVMDTHNRMLLPSPSQAAIAGMPGGDVLRCRELWLNKLITEWNASHKDAVDQCIEWIVALTSEMRLRGDESRAVENISTEKPPELQSMEDIDELSNINLVMAREMWLVILVRVFRKKQSDEIEECLRWVVALATEVWWRGGNPTATARFMGAC